MFYHPLLVWVIVTSEQGTPSYFLFLSLSRTHTHTHTHTVQSVQSVSSRWFTYSRKTVFLSLRQSDVRGRDDHDSALKVDFSLFSSQPMYICKTLPIHLAHTIHQCPSCSLIVLPTVTTVDSPLTVVTDLYIPTFDEAFSPHSFICVNQYNGDALIESNFHKKKKYHCEDDASDACGDGWCYDYRKDQDENDLWVHPESCWCSWRRRICNGADGHGQAQDPQRGFHVPRPYHVCGSACPA